VISVISIKQHQSLGITDFNKFVDCAIAANAQYIVSEDSHFKHLKDIPFPTVNVIHLGKFMELLMKQQGVH